MAASHRASAPTYKVVLLGEPWVGKTSLLCRLEDNTFYEDSCTKVVEVDGETVQLSIWDGSKFLDDLVRNYPNPCYYNADAAVFVYDVSEAESLRSLIQWIQEAENYSPNAIRMFIGNKVDLEPETDPKTVSSFAEAHEIELQFEISCKTNSGIDEAFKQLARVLHNSCQRSPKTDSIIRGTE